MTALIWRVHKEGFEVEQVKRAGRQRIERIDLFDLLGRLIVVLRGLLGLGLLLFLLYLFLLFFLFELRLDWVTGKFDISVDGLPLGDLANSLIPGHKLGNFRSEFSAYGQLHNHHEHGSRENVSCTATFANEPVAFESLFDALDEFLYRLLCLFKRFFFYKRISQDTSGDAFAGRNDRRL